MDRNIISFSVIIELYAVALRKESVDRNTVNFSASLVNVIVALRKESVDRNLLFPPITLPLSSSLSARRAWIEMFPP